MDNKNNDSKLTKLTEEGKAGLWKHILLHSSREDITLVTNAMYQLAEIRYQCAILRYDTKRLPQT